MEVVILSFKELQLIKKLKRRLEVRYNVEILLPNDSPSPCTDVILGCIKGDTESIARLKRFIAVRMPVSENKKLKDVTVINLSDCEESSSNSFLEQETVSNVDNGDSSSATELSLKAGCVTDGLTANDSVCIINRVVDSPDSSSVQDDSICIIEDSDHSPDSSISRNDSVISISDNSRKLSSYDPDIMIISPENSVCIPSPQKSVSTVKQWYCRDITIATKKIQLPLSPGYGQDNQDSNTSAKIHSWSTKVSPFRKLQTVPEFIPIGNKSKMPIKRKKLKKRKLNDYNFLKEEKRVRRLRPVVIDGSNVAILHGQVTDTFSCKGIQLCVEYFLNRGHTQVTAFVPNYRRHSDRKKFHPTTDAKILEELAKKQLVVFTPSRRVNGRCISSYDDRFMVKLATQNGGVLVSNDNFKDLLNENESYKEVIEKRLLQYCFVGDVFMVPDDPLGRNGPNLEDFLSFPFEEPPPN